MTMPSCRRPERFMGSVFAMDVPSDFFFTLRVPAGRTPPSPYRPSATLASWPLTHHHLMKALFPTRESTIS